MKIPHFKEGLAEKVTEWMYEVMFFSNFCHMKSTGSNIRPGFLVNIFQYKKDCTTQFQNS